MDVLPNTVCPVCGGANQCAPAGAGTFDVACWCTKTAISPEALARIPKDLVDKSCLCPRCAAGVGLADAKSSPATETTGCVTASSIPVPQHRRA